MSKNYTTNAINLTSYDFSENDKIIVMYSKEKGLIRGLAKGCKKPKSKLGATMQALVANKIIMNKGRNLDIISQVEALDSFKNLKKDFNKLSLSMYCAEIISNFGVEEDINSNEIYDLLYNGLNALSEKENTVDLILCVLRFQLKIMAQAGLKISLKTCSNCGCEINDDENYKFSIVTGGILCSNCYKKLTNLNGRVVSLHPKIIEFLSILEKTDFREKTIYDQKATQKICITCFNLLKDYISYHSPKKFKTADMIELTV